MQHCVGPETLMFNICRMEGQIHKLDWNDTFLSIDHLEASFPDYKIKLLEEERRKNRPPFRYEYL